MVKALVFDCFGVLTTEGWLAFKAQHFGSSGKLFQEATSLIGQANSGLISHEDFISCVAELAKVDPSEVQTAMRRNVPNRDLFTYIQGLKPEYRIGLLSNVAGNYLAQIFSKEQLSIFDAICLSFETGAVKPENRAFEIMAQELGVNLQDSIFIDDQEGNVSGAEQAGMQGILYKDLDQLKSELQPLLGGV